MTVHCLTAFPENEATIALIRTVLSNLLPSAFVTGTAIRNNTRTGWEDAFVQLADQKAVCLILSVGGIDPTGHVPAATEATCSKLFPGFGTLVRQEALRNDPTALLWRNTAGLRHQTLIVNLPAAAEAIQAGLPLLFPAIPNAIRLAGG